MSKVFNVYDSGLAYPQAARLGEGKYNATKDRYIPPPGMAFHDVTALVEAEHGIDNEFYTTTAADTLTPKSQIEVDQIIADRAAATAADKVAKQSRATKVRDDVGQGVAVPEIRDRLDDLIAVLQDNGTIPK